MERPHPPVAKKVPVERVILDEAVLDEYRWLEDRSDPDTKKYIDAENAYAHAVLERIRPTRQSLLQEMLRRAQGSQDAIPEKRGLYTYYTRTRDGLPHPVHVRMKDGGTAEEIVFDMNDLRSKSPSAKVNAISISPDGRLAAVLIDTDGSERNQLRVRDIAKGEYVGQPIPNVTGVEWANDNSTMFYTGIDKTFPPTKVYRHKLGDNPSHDVLVYEGHDPQFFYLNLTKSSNGRYILITAQGSTSSEIRYIDADRPVQEPKLLKPRMDNVLYFALPHDDVFYIVSNEGDGRFRVMEAPTHAEGERHFSEVEIGIEIASLDLWNPMVYLKVFKEHMVICDRKNGFQRVLVVNLRSKSTHQVFLPEESCSIHPMEHTEFDSRTVHLRYTSPITPWCLYEYDMDSMNLRHVWQQDVLGYDPTRYVTERVHAVASDSTRIPITLIYRKGLARSGRNPLLLHGYGAFASVAGVTSEFDPDLVSLLDTGFVFAEAHIRGNAVMGWDWYEHGRLGNKMNTFTDFITCAEYLITQGYTSNEKLAINGASAGGLLMGAVVNMRPNLAKVVIAEVPLVDLLNIMTDDKLAIGSSFVEEFGDPYDKPTYDLMRAYSPYENVSPGQYPDMLVTASWNDVWVPYWGPAKWVAKLRAKKNDDHPLLLLTSSEEGHSGPADRLGLAKWHSLMYAFLIDRLGAGEVTAMYASDGRPIPLRKF